MNTATDTIRKQHEWLAALRKPNGTLWLPELRRVCPKIFGYQAQGYLPVLVPYCEDHCMHEHHKQWRCVVCGGRGWFPTEPDALGLLETMTKAGWHYAGAGKPGIFSFTFWQRLPGQTLSERLTGHSKDKSPLKAIYGAAVMAMLWASVERERKP